MSISCGSCIGILLLAGSALTGNGGVHAQSPSTGQAYACEEDLIEIMFVADSRVRLRGDALVDLGATALDGVAGVLTGAGPYTWRRIAEVEEEILDRLQAEGEARTGSALYNLNNIYRLRVTPGPGARDVWDLSARLEALPGILLARPVPLPMPLPVPNYLPAQGYLLSAASAPTGIDAQFAWTQPGGDGTGITICDVEYSWNESHDDLTKSAGRQINSFVQDPFANTDHGTAVLGVLISDDNMPNWGTKGICPGASVCMSGSYFGHPAPSWNPAGAIAVALGYLKAGDVLLLEQQWDYTGTGGFVPVEWWMSWSPSPQFANAVYMAIQTATANGIHVVEAGGNGGVNTGQMQWLADSGAIIVGAGGAYPGGWWPEGDLERLSFSSYGPRFHLQGWGEDVVTTGYGDLYNAEGPDRLYTAIFSGTSSASAVVAGAVACCAGYQRASVQMSPPSPYAMRSLLIGTGTPQVFGPPGHIGPRPDLQQAINAMGSPPSGYADWGDAPCDAIAYPSIGAMGFFPTCFMGPTGYVRHHQGTPPFQAYFGAMVDFEPNGNQGFCNNPPPAFPPYDMDERFRDGDGDAGLILPGALTIQGGVEVGCGPFMMALGRTCSTISWGAHVDIHVTNVSPGNVFVNVLVDWDRNGFWSGAMPCPAGPASEHALVNFPVPPGHAGPLSSLGPPSFMSGPLHGSVWSRFTVSPAPVGQGWDGNYEFDFGETEDYLLLLADEQAIFEGDYGDAPEGALAYPSSGVMGAFPTCFNAGPSGYVIHGMGPDGYTAKLGPMLDLEIEGNAGHCANFPPYDADECYQDADAGLLFPPAYTIQGGVVVPCQPGSTGSLGNTCQAAVWGTGIDIWVDNAGAYTPAYMNILVDWNQDGRWQGYMQCPGGAAPEHVLLNFAVPPGYVGPLSGINPPPPAFMIGPRGGHVWARFTISYVQLPFDWNGHWVFAAGETEDYLLHVQGEVQEEFGDYGDAPEGAIAYPELGVAGLFPTCAAAGPSGFVFHQFHPTSPWFGPLLDIEFEGNAGNCPGFPPYDADECFGDGDSGLLHPPAYTIDATLNYVPCLPDLHGILGLTCTMALWGPGIDIHMDNSTNLDVFVNVLMDWNRDGQWQGASICPGGPAPEHVVVDLPVPPGFVGPLSALGPPPFLIGPEAGHIWTRFTISEMPVGQDWDGSAWFLMGETEDYLLLVELDASDAGDGNVGAIPTTRILACSPSPFSRSTTIEFEVGLQAAVDVSVCDVSGRHLRNLASGQFAPGRHYAVWDGTDADGRQVAAGVYFLRLRTAGEAHSRPVILIR